MRAATPQGDEPAETGHCGNRCNRSGRPHHPHHPHRPWPRLLARFAAPTLLALLALTGPASAQGAEPAAARTAELTVSAAASLANAFKALAPGFEARNPGTRLLLNFAASDALLVQIARGAPVDVFASADQEVLDRAAQRSLLLSGSRQDFAANTLVLIAPRRAVLQIRSLAELQGAAVQRIALGRPEGVPAGRYARAALQAAQLWPQLEAKAVYAQNVRQALDYVGRGEVEAGFVYASDAAQFADSVRVLFPVPTPTPIRYGVAIVAGSAQAPAAHRFIEHLLSPDGQAVLARHGFGRL